MWLPCWERASHFEFGGRLPGGYLVGKELAILNLVDACLVATLLGKS